MTPLHERKPRNTQSRLKNTLTLNQITEFTVKYTGHSPGPVSGPQTRMGQVPLGVQAQTHTGVVYMIICCWVRLRLLEFYRSPSQRMCRTIPKRQNRRIEEKPFLSPQCPPGSLTDVSQWPPSPPSTYRSWQPFVWWPLEPNLWCGGLWPWSRSFSKSAWYACNTDSVQSSTSLTSCHVCPTIQARCIY